MILVRNWSVYRRFEGGVHSSEKAYIIIVIYGQYKVYATTLHDRTLLLNWGRSRGKKLSRSSQLIKRILWRENTYSQNL